MNFTRIVALGSIAAVVAAAADSQAAGWSPRPGLEVSGIYGTVSRTDQETGDDVFDTRFGEGWSAGVTAEWPLSSRVAIASGLRYVNAGSREEITITWTSDGSTDTFRFEQDESWHWLAIPLRARVTPWALPLSFEAGPELQVLLLAKWRLDMDGPSFLLGSAGGAVERSVRAAANANIFEDVGTFGGLDVTDSYHRANFVLGGGVSYAWPVGTGRVVAHARYGIGLNDLMKSNGIERRAQGAEAGFGWQW